MKSHDGQATMNTAIDDKGNGSPLNGEGPVGAALVCGGGVAGIQASLDLSAAGFRVYLVEESPTIGGTMARLDKTFPTGDCATCIISPKLVQCMRDDNIDVLTMADVVSVEGAPGRFRVKVRQRPRYVNLAKCTACGDCVAVCPVELPSPFEAGLGKRKACDKVSPQSAPNAVVITKKERAACSSGCPIDTSVQAYVALIAAGKFEAAAEVIRRENPLPSICGRVCFHPCETECNRGSLDAPVNIRALKRFALEQSRGQRSEVGDQRSDVHAPTSDLRPSTSGKSVAIVGSGPAGLAAAHFLASAGHAVTVFESLPVLGGMLAVGIPDYRLPADVLQRDLDAIASLGVTFRTCTAIGRDLPPQQLVEQFQAVFLATGAHESRKLGIPGEESAGVIQGVDFLRKVALDQTGKGDGPHLCEAPEGPFRQMGIVPFSGSRVVIVGGGNTAIDAARTARRLGAAQVTIVYRRSREEMPADEAEIDAALHEDVEILYLAAPVSVRTEVEAASRRLRVTGVQCMRMELGEPDSSGRRRPVARPGSEFSLPADTLIPAVSQSSDQRLAELLGLKLTSAGAIETDALTMASSRRGIFAGGDAVAGPSSVIEAIAHGKQAAAAIDNYLAGRPLEQGLKGPSAKSNPLSPQEVRKLKRMTPAAPRVKPHELPVADRVANFREVEDGYTVEQAQAEARRCLNCAACCECMQCVTACQARAIEHDEQEKMLELDVGAVLLTPGFEAFDASRRGEFGCGLAPNVLTNVQFERMLSASGPTQGHIRRPADGKPPKRLAFIQCVGSRDSGCDNDYCSSVCCMAATKEAILAKEHEPGLEVTVFFLDLRAFGKDFDRYCDRAKNQLGVRYVRSFISRLYEMPGTGSLRLVYADPESGQGVHQIEEDFDMIVLSLGLEPSANLQEQAKRLDVVLNRWGFAQTDELHPLDTSRPGVFVGGAFQEPKDIPDTVMQASAAAARAMALLAEVRGTRVRTKTYPPERDIADEPPRVGVFVCHCGSNIAAVVDVQGVVQRIRELPYVAFAETNVYTCADDSQERMKAAIAEHRLNRVVVASCTPRTHEPIFRDTLRGAGLNPYLLEMANIRDQCSWVHSGDPAAATEKAVDLVRMSIARAVNLAPLQEATAPVNQSALVVGGGIAGMTAALAMADQGFPVHLVETDSRLGGTARRIHRTLDGRDVQHFLAETIARVNAHPRITVYLGARASCVSGHVGEFISQITAGEESREVHHGVVVVATGATEQSPTAYGYGQSDRVLTQLELSERLGNERLSLTQRPTVAMIQCVEQRDEKRPYCSRVCCTTAVKNALEIKRRWPEARVVVLYRDMRTYGFREAAYREAREKGVLFVRYDVEQPPRLEVSSQRSEVGDQRAEIRPLTSDLRPLTLTVRELSLGRDLTLRPDLVVLAAPVVPRADRRELSELLRVPLNADGFFLEAHMKLRPVDFASEGLFLCGTAHAPKFIGETIAQATAVAGRAASILSRKKMPVGGQIAWVDPDRCISCMTCVHVCPYLAPQVGGSNKAEVQGAVCMGCGSCSAECPAKAITLRHFVDAQILAEINSLLDGGRQQGAGSSEPGATNMQAPRSALPAPRLVPVYPEDVGVAQPRWSTER